MPIDRPALNDALVTALLTVGYVRISDEDLDDLTHRTADYLDALAEGND